MKCSDFKNKIDLLLQNPDIKPDAATLLHVESCAECARYLEHTRASLKLTSMLHQADPVLKDPEKLTDDIMNLILADQQAGAGSENRKHNNIRTLQIVQRMLAAASVCLLMVFSYEEFIVVDKISHLEKQNANKSTYHEFPAGFKLEKAGMLFSTGTNLPANLNELKSGRPKLFTLLKVASYLQKNNTP